MDVQRYENSLRVITKLEEQAQRTCQLFFNMRREILYLQSATNPKHDICIIADILYLNIWIFFKYYLKEYPDIIIVDPNRY